MDEERNLSLSVVPYEPNVLPKNLDLKTPPPNWLRPVGSKIKIPNLRKKKPKKMSSAMVANHYLNGHYFGNNLDLGGINAVAGAETIKQLIKLGSTNEDVSMMIHRIDDSLFMDDFDIQTELFDKDSKAHKWFKSILTNILCKEKNYSQIESDFISAISRLSGSELRSILSLESKFLYHSLPPSLPSTNNTGKGSGQENTSQKSECKSDGCFLQNSLWQFRDLGVLVGSDIPIFGNSTHPAVTLRLSEKQEINVLTGIDYWLENLMFSVPEVVMCFHINGIVQNYEHIATEDIPKVVGFDPELVKDTAKSIMSFLNSNCTEAGHTYWLFKEKQDDVVKLYDLSSLCKTTEKTTEERPKNCTDNPYLRPVASLLLRLVNNLEKESSGKNQSTKENEENEASITKLLYQALRISETLPDIREQVLKKLAYQVSRQVLVSDYKKPNFARKEKFRPRKLSSSQRNNKMQLQGASCIAKTSEVVNKYVNAESAEEFWAQDDFETDLNWISSALNFAKSNFETTSVLLSLANAISRHTNRNNFNHLKTEEQLGLLLLGMKCLSYATSTDNAQMALKTKNYSFFIERIADLQIPIITANDEQSVIKSLKSKFNPLGVIFEFFEQNAKIGVDDDIRNFICLNLEDIVRLYKKCLKVCDTTEAINRKIGNVYNEMGKKYIDSLILSSLAGGDEETETISTVNSLLEDHIIYKDKATFALEHACRIFEDCKDLHNNALCLANMGRLYQVLSSCYRIQSKELSTDEENDLRKSISYYKKAAEIVSKDMMSLKENLTWDMVNVLLRLATLYQENPPLSRLSVKESERKLIEILDTAEKHSSMLLKNTQNSERIYLRLAEINYRIAAMHHGHIVDSDISGKTLNHSIRLSLKYYQNSIENFNRVEWEEQNLSWCLLFLRASVEFTALIKNHKSNKSRFSEGLEIFKKSKKCIERLNCINPQYSDEMTKTTIKILSMVLMEIKKNISQFKNFTDKELNEIILICMRSKGEVENILNVLKKLESLEN